MKITLCEFKKVFCEEFALYVEALKQSAQRQSLQKYLQQMNMAFNAARTADNAAGKMLKAAEKNSPEYLEARELRMSTNLLGKRLARKYQSDYARLVGRK